MVLFDSKNFWAFLTSAVLSSVCIILSLDVFPATSPSSLDNILEQFGMTRVRNLYAPRNDPNPFTVVGISQVDRFANLCGVALKVPSFYIHPSMVVLIGAIMVFWAESDKLHSDNALSTRC